jgi:tetratricopeptide (TPR) repeat protein
MHRNIKWFIALTFMTITFCLNAQNGINRDSLLLEISTEQDLKKRVIKQSDLIIKLTGSSIESAEIYTDELIEEYRELNDTFCLARCISMKAYVVIYASRYEESVKLAREAYELQVVSKSDTMGLALTLVRMGMGSSYFGRLVEARERMSTALQYFKLLQNDRGVDMALNNLGVFSSQQEDYDGAIEYYKQSVAIRERLGQFFWLAYSQFNIAESYRAMEQMDSFTRYILLAERTFAQKAKKNLPTMVKMSLAEYHKSIGNSKKGIVLIKEGIEHSTKGGNTEMVILANQQLADFYFSDGQYKKAYETRLVYDSMQHQVDSINIEVAVAEVEEKYQSAKNKAEIDGLRVDKLEAEKGARTVAIVLTALLALALLFGYRMWELGKRNKIEKENEQLEMQAKLEKTKLLALRSQMNPHFIFNSINIAQSYILEANKEKAYEHLEKFAKLLRMTLDYSDKIFIPIEDEVAMVRLYLELEYNRFEPKFQFTLDVDEELNEGIYEVPGMIIQPFVENALIHGVLNLKEGTGEVSVELKKNGENVHCLIVDNGVGRVVAQEIKKSKSKRLRSIAIYNIQERASIISKHTKQEIHIETSDRLVDGKVAGTVVSFTLPLQ